MIKKEAQPPSLFQSDDTDELLPRAWKSGSLKYDELKPLSEGGTAKLFTTLDKPKKLRANNITGYHDPICPPIISKSTINKSKSFV